jgi:hypothetical protein
MDDLLREGCPLDPIVKPRAPIFTDRASIKRAMEMLPPAASQAAGFLSDHIVQRGRSVPSAAEANSMSFGACLAVAHKAGFSARSAAGQAAAAELFEGYGQDIFDVGFSYGCWLIETGQKIKEGAKTALKVGVIGTLAAFGIWAG